MIDRERVTARKCVRGEEVGGGGGRQDEDGV